MQGATGICIFEGIMNSVLYTDILKDTLLPFLRDVYPNGHRFMQDNDPKHTSKLTGKFIQDNQINWWKHHQSHPIVILSRICGTN